MKFVLIITCFVSIHTIYFYAKIILITKKLITSKLRKIVSTETYNRYINVHKCNSTEIDTTTGVHTSNSSVAKFFCRPNQT